MELTNLKTEIHRLVDELPEYRLVEMKNLLEQEIRRSPLSPERDELVEKIFRENYTLLKRLAES